MAPRIAIIDDDLSVREAVAGLLRSGGCDTEMFASAEEFLASGRLDGVDCLVLDLSMPGMSGLELQSHLAASNVEKPIIFITANEDATLRTKALQAGAAGYLCKPLDDEALLSAVQGAVGTK